jgi:hypothetical protein
MPPSYVEMMPWCFDFVITTPLAPVWTSLGHLILRWIASESMRELRLKGRWLVCVCVCVCEPCMSNTHVRRMCMYYASRRS